MAAPPTCLCFRCPAKCCRYLAIQMDTPEKPHEFEHIRWQLSHQDVFVFIEDGKWFIHLSTTCVKLRPDNRCGVYDARPTICREYSPDDCDFSGSDYHWSAKLTTPTELKEHIDRNGLGVRLPAFPSLARLPWRAGSAEERRLAKPRTAETTSGPAKATSRPLRNAAAGRAMEIVLPMLPGTLLGDSPGATPPSATSPSASPLSDDLGPVHEIGVFIDTPATWEDLENIRWYVMHDRVRIRVDADDKWTLLYRTLPQEQCGAGHDRCGTHCQPAADAGAGRYPHIFSDVESLMRFASEQLKLRKAAS